MDYGIENGQSIIFECNHCTQISSVDVNAPYWIETVSGSYKLCKCPVCGNIVELKYIEDENLDVNNDERYYY